MVKRRTAVFLAAILLVLVSFGTGYSVSIIALNDDKVSVFSQSIVDSDLTVSNVDTKIKGGSGNVDVKYTLDNPTSSDVTSNATVYLVSDAGNILNETTRQVTVTAGSTDSYTESFSNVDTQNYSRTDITLEDQ